MGTRYTRLIYALAVACANRSLNPIRHHVRHLEANIFLASALLGLFLPVQAGTMGVITYPPTLAILLDILLLLCR
jgi:hypothetical protein